MDRRDRHLTRAHRVEVGAGAVVLGFLGLGLWQVTEVIVGAMTLPPEKP